MTQCGDFLGGETGQLCCAAGMSLLADRWKMELSFRVIAEYVVMEVSDRIIKNIDVGRNMYMIKIKRYQ